MRRTTEDALSFLGGAAVGATVMYLLDPDLGEPRRHYWGERATDAWDRAGTTLGHTWDSARAAGRRSGRRAGSAASTAGSYLGGLGSRAGDLRRRLGDSSHRLIDRYWHGERRQPMPLPDGTTLLFAAAAMAAGIGMMFLLDPSAGRRRRAVIRDKTMSYARQTGRSVSKTARHLRNRARGLAHETGLAGDGEGLIARIRERLSGVLGRQNAEELEISYEGGDVTLSTSHDLPEQDRLIEECRSIAGVHSVSFRRAVISAANAPGPSGFTPGPTEGTGGPLPTTSGPTIGRTRTY